MYYSEYFNVFEYVDGTSHKIKKVGRILAKLLKLQQKGKPIITETFHLVTKVFEDGSFSR